jgi:hypothetical protein
VEYGSPAPFYASALAIVCGGLIATAHHVAAAVTGAIAVVVFWLWRAARDRGDDDRHALW